MKKLILTISAIAAFQVPAFAAPTESQNINEVVSGAKEKYKGLRYFKPVLMNVLYRGGGPGGTIPLQPSQLNALCEDGFSHAGYLYGKESDRKAVNCGTNTLTYAPYGFKANAPGAVGPFLKVIHDIIKGKSGPMFVHCWNGWHASGEVAAASLIQFCGFTPEEAAKYWAANIGDSYKPQYESILNRIRSFKKIDNLQISAEESARICPNR